MLEKMIDFIENKIDSYDEHMMTNILGANEFYSLTASKLPRTPNAKVLDLGCGTGLELQEYFTLNPSAKVTGIDLSQWMLDKLKSKFPDKEIDLICASYFDVPFGENIFDAAVSVESLHHFTPEAKIALYTKLHKSLKEDGYFILTDYFSLSDAEETEHFEHLKKLKEEYGLTDNELYHYDTPLTLEHEIEVLQEAGFSSFIVYEDWDAICTLKARKREDKTPVWNGPEFSRRLERLSDDTMLLISDILGTDKHETVTNIIMETTDPLEADRKIHTFLRNSNK